MSTETVRVDDTSTLADIDLALLDVTRARKSRREGLEPYLSLDAIEMWEAIEELLERRHELTRSSA